MVCKFCYSYVLDTFHSPLHPLEFEVIPCKYKRLRPYMSELTTLTLKLLFSVPPDIYAFLEKVYSKEPQTEFSDMQQFYFYRQLRSYALLNIFIGIFPQNSRDTLQFLETLLDSCAFGRHGNKEDYMIWFAVKFIFLLQTVYQVHSEHERCSKTRVALPTFLSI